MKLYIVTKSKREKVLYVCFILGFVLYYSLCKAVDILKFPEFINIIIDSLPGWMFLGEFFSLSVCVLFFNYLCNQILWRNLLKSYLSIPDLNGEWEGEIISNYPGNGKETKLRMELHIKQTLFEISCTSQFFKSEMKDDKGPNSKSFSDFVEIDNSNPDEPILKFSYRNDSQEREVQSPSSQGFNVLNISNNTMNGFYFTNRPFKDREVTTYTGGKIILKKTKGKDK